MLNVVLILSKGRGCCWDGYDLLNDIIVNLEGFFFLIMIVCCFFIFLKYFYYSHMLGFLIISLIYFKLWLYVGFYIFFNIFIMVVYWFLYDF